MAVVMHEGTVSLDNTSGTPVDISSYVQQTRINYEKATSSFFTLGSKWNDALEGGITTRIQATVLVTAPATEGHGTFRAAMVTGGKYTYTVSTPDGSPGSLELSGEVVVGGMSPAIELRAGSADAQTSQIDMLGAGDWTPTVIT